MIDILNKLIKTKKNNKYLSNKIILTCPDCGNTEKYTYYHLLQTNQFETSKPTTVPNPYIQESYIEEEIIATPIRFKMQCPNCGNEMEAYSPVPMEYIINLLQSPPPDELMYG